MAQNTYISNMADLQQWFELQQEGQTKHPYFTLYRGYEQKPDRILSRNETEDDPTAAWEMLEKLIQWNSSGGGSFRVFVTKEAKLNVGITTLVNIPNPMNNQSN